MPAAKWGRGRRVGGLEPGQEGCSHREKGGLAGSASKAESEGRGRRLQIGGRGEEGAGEQRKIGKERGRS